MLRNKEYDHCLRCGRKLKNPVARQLGYGAICIKKVQNNDNSKLFTVTEDVNNCKLSENDN